MKREPRFLNFLFVLVFFFSFFLSSFDLAIADYRMPAQPVSASIIKEECLNDTHVRLSSIFNQTTNSSTTTYEYVQNHECLNGCSSSLGTCRMDEFNEVLYLFIIFGGIMLYCILSMYMTKMTDTLVYVALFMIAFVLCITLALTDAFSTTYRTILFLFAFIPIMFIIFAYDSYVKEKAKEEED